MSRVFRVGCALLLGLATAACASIGGAPLDEAAELATMGRERTLRQPMRPVRGGTRVLIFALDGVGHDDLHRALREGRMPRVGALLGPAAGSEGVFAHAYSVPGVLSILPSSTIPAWTALFTGEPPARNGIAGNEWFAREEMRFYAPVPASVRSRGDATRLYTDELLSGLIQTPTLYEGLELRSHVGFHPVFRGADLLTLPNLGAFGDLVEELAEGVVGGGTTTNPGVYRETDQSSTRSLVGALADYGVPDVQVAYLPGVDLLTHQAESPLESQQRYLEEVVDPAIGSVLDAYRERDALANTYVIFVADHGHTPVLDDDLHSLGTGGEDEPPAVLEKAGFRVRPSSLSGGGTDFQAVLAYQGAMAYVYLADRGTCPEAGSRCDWSRPPRLREDVLPAARAFFEASRSGAGVPEMRGVLDLVLAREPRPAGEDALPFQVFDGERLVPIGEYLRHNPRPDLLRLEERLSGLAAGPHGHRAGDVLLLSRFGEGIPIEQRFYFASPSTSDHGSAHAQDSRIPLVVARPGRSGEELRRLVRQSIGESPTQLDVVPLVRALLGQPPAP